MNRPRQASRPPGSADEPRGSSRRTWPRDRSRCGSGFETFSRLSPFHLAMRTPLTRRRPATSLTTCPARTGIPRACACSPSVPAPPGRLSTMAATSAPAPAKLSRRPVCGIVVGEDHRAAAGQDRIPVDVGRHGRGQHYAGAVVIAEHQRPLQAALRQHHLPGADPPEPLPYAFAAFGLSRMAGATLGNRQEVVIVVTENRAPGQQDAVFPAAQLRNCGGGPLRRRDPFDARRRSEQTAAEFAAVRRRALPGRPISPPSAPP